MYYKFYMGEEWVKSEEINRDLLQLIELGESLHAVFVVDDAACFAATVHGEDGIAHIHTLQWDGGGEDMFLYCQTLTTIYVSDEFVITNITKKDENLCIRIGDGTTAIKQLEADAADGKAEYYDLQGHRLQDLQKGVNIVKRGGKTMKVIIK